MNMKIALVLGALLVLIIGVSCSTAIDFNHNDAQHIKHNGVAVKEISNSSFEKAANATQNTQTVKKSTKSNVKSVAASKSSQKVKAQKPVVKAEVKKAVAKNDSLKPYERTINGWNPKDHEVSREDLGDGWVRIYYDDGYSRIIDKDGNVVTYGY